MLALWALPPLVSHGKLPFRATYRVVLLLVGSAAFNLMCISAVCVVAIPTGELRRVKDMNVFAITGICSVFAYLWLIIILTVWTPNVVTVPEAVLTFLFFPILVCSAYGADKVI